MTEIVIPIRQPTYLNSIFQTCRWYICCPVIFQQTWSHPNSIHQVSIQYARHIAIPTSMDICKRERMRESAMGGERWVRGMKRRGECGCEKSGVMTTRSSYLSHCHSTLHKLSECTSRRLRKQMIRI